MSYRYRGWRIERSPSSARWVTHPPNTLLPDLACRPVRCHWSLRDAKSWVRKFERLANTLLLLERARNFYAMPDRWSQGTEARDWKGRPVPLGSKNAYAFCPTGLLYLLAPSPEVFLSALSALEKVLLARGVLLTVANWNDLSERDIDDVVGLLAEAATSVRQGIEEEAAAEQ